MVEALSHSSKVVQKIISNHLSLIIGKYKLLIVLVLFLAMLWFFIVLFMWIIILLMNLKISHKNTHLELFVFEIKCKI